MSKAWSVMVLAVFAAFVTAAGGTVVDEYSLVMKLQVPRIYDNTESLGKRKYQVQRLEGTLYIAYADGEEMPQVMVSNLVNKTHKIGGKGIRYSCTVDEGCTVPRVNLIGSNRTGVFNVPTMSFGLDAEPDYNVGEDDEDNSLIVNLAGKGATSTDGCGNRRIRIVKGYVAGTMGCGCRAYGHVSPTRVADACGASDLVDDVAAVFGVWYAKFRRRVSKP